MAGFNAEQGKGYMVNTTAEAYTATLPASPTVGKSVGFADYAKKFGTNALTISGNGKYIEGSGSPLILNTNGIGCILTYIDATRGWIVTG